MTTILEEIIAHKRTEVAIRQKQHLRRRMINEISASTDLPRGFLDALRDRVDIREPAVIAEIKQASPSQGVITTHFDPAATAVSYAENGAACLSVLTDECYFQGHDNYLCIAREKVALPILRKDFIIDDFQVAESRLLGADAILLIAAVLDDIELHDFTLMAHDLGMDVLVEVHDKVEFERALKLPIRMIGVNNRNLHDFSVNLQTSIDLAKHLPEDWLLISESGIATYEDVTRLQEVGIYSYLIGSSLMAAEDPGMALAELINGGEE